MTGPISKSGVALADGAAPGVLDMASLRPSSTRQLTTFDVRERRKTLLLRRGRTTRIGEVSGAGYIAQLWLTFPGFFWQAWSPAAPFSSRTLKTLILKLTWDGARRPAVEVPIGDFFGIGLCRTRSFATRWFGMSSGGFYCKFPMPFRRGFKLEITNLDPHIDTELFCNVLYQLEPGLPQNLGYFHAQFRTGRLRGPAAMTIAEAKGRGHYAGCTLSMQGEPRGYLSYLEAPEYVYLDDDWQSPRIVGTGLEDYFLGGWYFRDGAFVGPLNGAPLKDEADSSVSMYRVHEGDAIRFEKRLKFCFLNPWEAARLKNFAYSSAAFLYLDTPEAQAPALPALRRLLCWYRVPEQDPHAV